jgi:hypothetical protein
LALSSDAGDSWQPLQPPPGFDAGAAVPLWWSPAWTGFCGLDVTNVNGAAMLLAYPSVYYLAAPTAEHILHSLDGGASWTNLDPPGDVAFLSYAPQKLLSRQVVLPGAVVRGTLQGDLWEYSAFAPCSIQPVLGFGQVWMQYPELRQPAGCPVAPEQPATFQTRHFAKSGESYDLYWSATAHAPCVQVFDHGRGLFTAGLVQSYDAQGCTGLGDQTRNGSILTFANGLYWVYIADNVWNGFVTTSIAPAWTQPLIRL